jgi:hypothetical protein
LPRQFLSNNHAENLTPSCGGSNPAFSSAISLSCTAVAPPVSKKVFVSASDMCYKGASLLDNFARNAIY